MRPYPRRVHDHRNFREFINKELQSDAFMNYHMRETLRIVGGLYSPAVAAPEKVIQRFKDLYTPWFKTIPVVKSQKDVVYNKEYRLADKLTRAQAQAKLNTIAKQISRRAGWAASRYFWASKALNTNAKYRFGIKWTQKHIGSAVRRLSRHKGRTVVTCSKSKGTFDTGEKWMEKAYNNKRAMRVNDFSLQFVRDNVTAKYFKYLEHKFKHMTF